MSTAFNITTTTKVKAGPGKIVAFSIVVAGAAGAIHDAAATGDAAAGNLIAALPAAVGVTQLNCPVLVGIVVAPGAGQTVSVIYE